MKNKNSVNTMILAAMFLALAYVLPFFTGQIPQVGSMLCPMHIPVLLCGFFCGGPWGIAVGFIAPLLRSLTLGMPPLFPAAVCMAFELAAYGAVSGFLHKMFPRQKRFVYITLVIAMIVGRLVWGAAMLICLGVQGSSFTFSAFLAGAVLNAVPGIAAQLVLIPLLVIVLKRYHLFPQDSQD